MSDVRGIVIDFLKANGYDGLCGCECGCGSDDLMPCGGNWSDCAPGHEWRCAPGCPQLAGTSCCEYEDEGGRCWRSEKQAEAVARRNGKSTLFSQGLREAVES